MSAQGAERTRKWRERIDASIELVPVPVSGSAVMILSRLHFLAESPKPTKQDIAAAVTSLIRKVGKGS